jgi:hypothetical protein
MSARCERRAFGKKGIAIFPIGAEWPTVLFRVSDGATNAENNKFR